MGAPKKVVHQEEPKICPECGEEMTSRNVVVEAKGWKALYVCYEGHRTPTAALRK